MVNNSGINVLILTYAFIAVFVPSVAAQIKDDNIYYVLGKAPGPPCVYAPCSVSTAFRADLLGKPDTREGTWGTTDHKDFRVPFHPPAGFRVRIVRVQGGWIASTRKHAVAGTKAGLLFAMATSDPKPSNNVDLSSDGCFFQLPGQVSEGWPFTEEFDWYISNGLLGADNVLVVRLASSTTIWGFHYVSCHTSSSFISGNQRL